MAARAKGRALVAKGMVAQRLKISKAYPPEPLSDAQTTPEPEIFA